MFHVYIDRPTDPSPGGRTRLAAALASRFRLAEDQVSGHLAAGRLRVKSNVDEPTARAFAQELEALGAIVSIENASTGVALSARAAAPTYESGLSAAFSSKTKQVSLGALEQVDMGAEAPPPLTLGTLDGAEDVPPPPPAGHAKLGQTSPPLDVGVVPLPKASPLPENPFAPPDDRDAPLELADSPARPSKTGRTIAESPPIPPPPSSKRGTAPPPRQTPAPMSVADPLPPPPASPAPSSPHPPLEAHAPPPQPAPPVRGGSTVASSGPPLARFFDGKPRQRVLAGLALAMLVGFGVAHFYASSAEGRYAEIRRSGEFAVAPANNEEYQHQLEERRVAVEAMGKAKTRILVSSGVMWILVGAGVGFVFFRFLA